jgi:hypothetical protein
MTQRHWFWRAATAVVVACIYMGFSVTLLGRFNEMAVKGIVRALGGARTLPPKWQIGVGVSLVYGLPVVIIAVAVYAWLTHRFGPRVDREIPCPKCGYVGHCRKCGYNLTGNVSGVCPECGEKALP